jgi:hypothetical protein
MQAAAPVQATANRFVRSFKLASVEIDIIL